MSQEVRTILVVHAAAQWRTFHRRAMLLALAKALPPTVGMLGVDRPVSPDVASWKHPKRFWSALRHLRVDVDEGNIPVILPRLPLHEHVAWRIPGAIALNSKIFRAQLCGAIARQYPYAERVVHWIYYPVQRWIWKCFPDDRRIYECYDEYARSSNGELHAGRWQEELGVLRDADLMFATARSLLESRTSFARRAQLLPNGVADFFFDDSRPALPDPIDALPRPRIGYIGNLRGIVDYRLLEQVFDRQRQWNLVVVGPIAKGIPAGGLLALPNVHILGPRSHRFLQQCGKFPADGLREHLSRLTIHRAAGSRSGQCSSIVVHCIVDAAALWIYLSC